MAVTDEQLRTLRAQLAGKTEEHLRMLGQLDPVEAKTGYSMLIGAAFFEAAERRFIRNGKYVPDAEVIDFVAAVRSVNEDTAATLDPVIAERILFAALDKGEIDDIDDATVLGHEMFLLAAMIADEGFSDEELDAFLARARETADQWLSQ